MMTKIEYTKIGTERTLTSRLIFESKLIDISKYESEDHKLIIMGSLIIISSGFKWNGMTWHRDNKKTDVPSCIHDALNRYKNVPFDNKMKDDIFYEAMKEQGFLGRFHCYLGSRLFGDFFKS